MRFEFGKHFIEVLSIVNDRNKVDLEIMIYFDGRIRQFDARRWDGLNRLRLFYGLFCGLLLRLHRLKEIPENVNRACGRCALQDGIQFRKCRTCYTDQ